MGQLRNQRLLRDGVIAKYLKHYCYANEDTGEATEDGNPVSETK